MFPDVFVKHQLTSGLKPGQTVLGMCIETVGQTFSLGG